MKVFIIALLTLCSISIQAVECEDDGVCFDKNSPLFINPVDIRPNIILVLDREDSISIQKKLLVSPNLEVLRLLVCFRVSGDTFWLKEAEVQYNNGLEYEDTPLRLNKILNHRTFKKLSNLYKAREGFKCLCGEIDETGSTTVPRNVFGK